MAYVLIAHKIRRRFDSLHLSGFVRQNEGKAACWAAEFSSCTKKTFL
jgi:hypothetical protein